MDSETGVTEPLEPTPSTASDPPAAARDPLGAGRALLLYLLFFVGQFGVGIIVAIVAALLAASRGSVAPAGGVSPELLMAASLLGVVTGAWLVLEFAVRWSRGQVGGLAALDIGWSAGTRRQVVASGVAGALLAVLYIASIRWFMTRWRDPELGPTLSAVQDSPIAFVAWAVFAVLFAPPFEELLFRGLMLRGLSRSWGPFAAGLSVTALFVAAHMFETGFYVPGLMAIASLGCATLAARAVTGALGPAIALHAGYNFVIAMFAGQMWV